MNNQTFKLDEETNGLWNDEFKKFLDKGGFQKLLRDVPNGPPMLDLNIYLPTFKDLAKLDLKIEYIIPGLIPKQSIILLHGRGGGLKTWLALELGARISEGDFFVGLPTEKVPIYYIDYENSLPMLVDRTKIIGPSEMKLWHISNPIPPPHLDSSEWILFKSLLPGLIIFDTLRSCQLLDENSSKDMALIMGRLKELREIGHTILLLHHTQKADTRTYKGSTAILDLCDHVLGLERVREVGSDTVVDEDESDLPFRLGTREKTRYEPFSIFLKFDASIGFSIAENPDDQALRDLSQILKDNEGDDLNQSEFSKAAKDVLEINKIQFRRLLKKGMGRFWTEIKGSRNASIYHPISVFQGKNEPSNSVFQKGQQSSLLQVSEKTEFSSFPVTPEKTKKTDQIQFSSFPPLFIEEKTKQLEDNLEKIDEGE